MDRPTCKTCPFWDTSHDADIIAGFLDEEYSAGSDHRSRECRRYPPARSQLTQFQGAGRDEQASDLIGRGWGNQAEWLHTDEDDWCGEHPNFPAWIASREAPERAVVSLANGKINEAIGSLSTRARKGIGQIIRQTGKQISELTDADFCNVRNCGQKTIEEIIRFLNGRPHS